MASLHRGVDQAIVSNLGRMVCVFNQLHQSLKIGKKNKIKKKIGKSHNSKFFDSAKIKVAIKFSIKYSIML
jgi:predicted DNA-binding protein YlxM (UPF0122 family)